MTTLEQRIASLVRNRTQVILYRSMPWFRRLDEEQKHVVEARIGMCCGDGPCTVAAYALAMEEVGL